MDLRFWADLSVIYLIGMQLVPTILMIVVLYFIVRGVMIARRKATTGVKLAQYYVGIARTQTNRFADKAADPLVRSHAEAARGEAIARSLLPNRPSSATSTKEQDA